MILAGFVVLGLVGAPPAWEYSNSTGFCADTCHTMPPAHETYLDSPHARVPCVDCHIGRGLIIEQFARKSGHMRLVWATVTGNYEYPIHVSHMRPARDTCELCHFPEKFSDDSVRVLRKAANNETNDPYDVYLLMKTGGGSAREGLGKGIHWHVENKVQFVDGHGINEEIPWVRVTRSDGSQDVFASGEGAHEPVSEESLHTMDCIDCHNRISHTLAPPAELVDEALRSGTLPSSVPFLRERAVNALLQAGVGSDADAVFADMQAWYRERYPQLAADPDGDLAKAMVTLRSLREASVFEEQELDWATHADNIGHEHWPGCFRCHDGRHKNEEGEAIRLECNLCHSIPAVVRPGVSQPSIPLAMGIEPESHKTTTWISQHHNLVDASCASCHDITDAGGTSDQGFCSNSQCHGNRWKYGGFDAPALAADLNIGQAPVEVGAVESGSSAPTFATLQPALAQACGACHGATASKGLNVTTWAALKKGGASGPAFVAGKSSESLIVKKLEKGHFARLPSKSMEALRAWIDAGAPEGPPVVAAGPSRGRGGSGWGVVGQALSSSCGGCHGRRIANSGLDVSSVEALLKGGRSGAAVVPGDASGSLLVKKLEKGHFASLSPSDMDALKAWIGGGAKAGGGGGGSPAVEASWSSLQPILKGSCGACHGRHAPQKGLNVTDHDGILKGSSNGPVIVAGKPDESSIVRVLGAGHFARLSPQEMAALKSWIGAGAMSTGAAPVADTAPPSTEPVSDPGLSDMHATREVTPDGLPCVGCHSAQASVLGTDHDAAVVPVAGRSMTCLSCHFPDRRTPYRMESKPGVNPASGRCLSCHDGRAVRSPGATTHPADVLLTTEGLPFPVTGPSPYYGPDGAPVTGGGVGEIACTTCHDPHRWSRSGNPHPGPADGNEQNSFLKDPMEISQYCSVCHGDDGLQRLTSFHGSTYRKKGSGE